jgi:opacity protein-like surface antigen
MMKRLLLGAAMAAATATASHAAITVNGVLDADYGAATASVPYDSAAPVGDFSGSPASNNVAYDIYLKGQDGYVYVFLQAAGSTNGLNFSNLYFNIDGVGGSDLGFEVTNERAFIPGGDGAYSATPIEYALGTNSLEFAISASYFTTQLPGLTYFTSNLPSIGDSVQLRLSQSLGYSVAGGASFGADRLGYAELTAGVPEPATWAMMVLGFMGAGAALRRRTAVRA